MSSQAPAVPQGSIATDDPVRLYVDEVEEGIISEALARSPENGEEPPARVVTCSEHPFAMLRANDSFHSLTGLEAETAYGSSFKLLHTEATNVTAWESCMNAAVKSSDPQTCVLNVELAGGTSEVMRMDVTSVSVGKGLERKLLLVEMSKAQQFQTLADVQANTAKGARAIVRLINPQHITHVSDGWCTEFESDRKQFVGRSLKGLNGPATDQRIVQRMMKRVSRCLPAEETFVAYCLNGTMKLVNLRCFPLQRETGEVDHFCVDAVTSPILTLREAARQPADEPSIVLSVDASRSILRASPAFNKMMNMGDESASLEGKSLSALLNADLDGPALDAAIRDAVHCTTARRRAAPLVITLFGNDAKPVVAKAQLVPLLDSQFAVSHVRLLLGLVDVVTLAAASAASASPHPKVIASIAHDAVVKHASPAWCDIYGYSQDEVVGQSLLRLVHVPEASSATLQEMQDKVSAGKTYEFTMPTLRADGALLEATLRATPVLSEVGRLDLCMTEVLDVKEVKALAPQSAAGQAAAEEEGAAALEYPITPTGHITHINGYTQLVLYPKADPTLEACIDYLEHLRDAAIVRGWKWDGDALRVNVDTRKVLNYTHRSLWCRTWTPNLRTWDAWWNRMLWVVGEASRRQHAKDESDLASDLDFLSGTPHTFPALDDLFSSDFARLSDSDAASSASSSTASVAPDAADDDDAASACSPSRPCLSSAPLRPEAISDIALRRLQASPLFRALAPLAPALAQRGLAAPVCLLDAKGHVLFASPELLAQTGYDARHALGLPWSFLSGPKSAAADVNRFQASLEAACPGGPDIAATLRLRHREGRWFWASLLARPVAVEAGGEAHTVLCASIEDESFIVEGLDDAALEYDTYTQVAREELELEQDDTITAVAKLLRKVATAAPATEHVKAEPEAPLFARSRLLSVGDQAACIDALWVLKAEGAVRGWVWEEEGLAVDAAHGEVPPKLLAFAAAATAADAPRQRRQSLATPPSGHTEAASPPVATVKSEPDAVATPPPVEVKTEVKTEPLAPEEEIRRLQAQVAALQAQVSQQQQPPKASAPPAEEVAALQAQLQAERAVNSAALAALGKTLASAPTPAPAPAPRPHHHDSPASQPQARAQPQPSAVLGGRARAATRAQKEAERVRAREAEFVRLSGDGQRQYARQVEAAHAFLQQQLGLDAAAVWTPALLRDFGEAMARGGELHSGFCLCDDLGGVMWSSASFQEVTGFSAAGAFGCQWISLLCGPETDAEELAGVQRGMEAGELSSACLFAMHEDGSPMWLQVRQQPMKLAGCRGSPAQACFALVVDDVTPLIERVCKGRDAAGNPITVRAANVIAQRQRDACDQGAVALRILNLARAAADEASAEAHRPAPQHSAPKSRRAEDEMEVVLWPGGDAAEVMVSRVLWRLRERGLVRRWTWEGDLSLRLSLWGSAVWPGAAEERGWGAWWGRMQAVAAGGAASVLRAHEALLTGPEAKVMCSAREPWMILEANAAMRRLTGYTNAEIKGRSLCMLQSVLDWPQVVRAVRAAENRCKGAPDTAAPAGIPVKATGKDERQVDARLFVQPVVGEAEVEFICAQYQPGQAVRA